MAEKNRNATVYRLLIGFISVILLFIVFGVISLIEIRTLSKVTRTIYNHPLVVSNSSLRATASMIKMHRSMKDVALFEFPSEINTAINAVNVQERIVFENLDNVKKNILGDEGQQLEDETRNLFVNWKPIREEVIQLVRKGQREAAAKITTGKGADYVVKLENKMLELTAYARNKATGFIQYGEKIRSRVMNTTIILISIGSLLSVFIAFFTIRRTLAADEEIRRGRLLLESSIESPKDMIILSLDREYRYLYFNKPHAESMSYVFGTRPQIGDCIFDHMKGEDDIEKVKGHYDRTFAGESHIAIEEYGEGQLRYTYEIRYNPIYGEKSEIIGVTSFAQDITERKQAEEALRESEERFKAIFEFAPDAYYLNDLDGSFIDGNKAAESVTGFKKEELIGKNFFELNLLSTEELPKAVELLAKNAGGFPTGPDEFVLNRKDGTLVTVEISTDPINMGGQDIVLGIARDVSERKRLESQIQQSQKMESIGTLAGGIAHEFNNILGIIIGNTELAIDDVPEWNPAKECLKEIRAASMRAKDVVRHILSFARKTPAQRQPIQISTIIRDSLKLMRASIPTTIEIRQNLSCESEMILADPTEINQILMNFCTNSVHALSEETGVLEVSLESINLDRDSASQYEGLNTGNFVKLTVKDTGQGIDPKIMDRIFDPYFTTKDIDRGTGMGLAIAYGIIKKHDGAIKATSELGKGTVFEVLFPLIEETVQPELEEEPEALPTGTERILFVDDEVSLGKMAKQMLERLGYQVITNTNPKEALALFKAEPDQFDLVITDMAMPQMPGDRLAQELMKIRNDIPVILCTGHSARIDEDRAKKLGLAAYVMKPLVKKDFAITVRKVLDMRRASIQG